MPRTPSIAAALVGLALVLFDADAPPPDAPVEPLSAAPPGGLRLP